MKNEEIISNLVWLQGRLQCIVNENKSMVQELQSSIDLIVKMIEDIETEKPKKPTANKCYDGGDCTVEHCGDRITLCGPLMQRAYGCGPMKSSAVIDDQRTVPIGTIKLLRKIKHLESTIKALKFTVEVLCKALDKYQKTVELPFEVGSEINGLLFVLATGGKLESVENRERARRGYNVLNPLLHRLQKKIIDDKKTKTSTNGGMESMEVKDIVIPGGMGYVTGFVVCDEMDILANGVGPVRILIIKQQDTKDG